MNKQKVFFPKLRFPEFLNAKGWSKTPLGILIEELRQKSTLQDEFEVLTSARNGLIRQREYYENNERVSGRDNIGFNVIPPSYLTYRSRSDDRRFFFNENDLGITGVISSYYPVFRLIDADNKFFVELLSVYSDIVGKHSVGTSQTVLSLNELRRIQLPLPKVEEQKKIASCISSIDALIEAQSQKFEALKNHKKGLMQQLFPREGETIPHLRFPEFRDALEWVEEPLGNVANYENGKAYEKHIAEEGKYVVVNSRFISTDGGVRKYTNEEFCIASAGNVLMVLSDLPNGKALAKCYFAEADNLYAVNQRVCRLEAHSINDKFLYYLLNRHPRLLSYDDGMNQTHLKKESVLNCLLSFPKQVEEQQKIADCLSSIDTLIVAHGQKLKALKIHKMGLRQQLFPAVNEVGA